MALIRSEEKFLEQFEDVLLDMARAEPIHKVLKDRRIHESFIAWCHADEERKLMYEKAQGIATEHLAGQMLELTSSPPSPEDAFFIKTKVDVLKYLMGAWNRKRYGDTKQVEITNTVDISDAMDAANARLEQLRKPVLIEQE